MTRRTRTRVLVTIDSLLAGGAERVAVQTAARLDPDRYLAQVLVSRGTGPLEQDLRDARVPYTILGREKRFDMQAMKAAGEIISHADIVHSHKFANNLFTLMAARNTNVPVVVHEHNWSDESGMARTMLDRFVIARRASRYVCCAQSVADVVAGNGVPSEMIDVVENGVELSPGISRAQARATLTLPSDEIIIGIIAQLRPEKAHDVLLRAMADVPSRIDGRSVHLCIIGDGPGRADLEALAVELGIERRTTFAGEIDRASSLVSAFDLGVLASNWEGLPLAVLEFMSQGVPMVTTAVGALPELIGGTEANRPAGWVVPPGDAPAMAGAITEALTDRDLAGIRGGHGRRRVLRSYSVDETVRRVEDVYDQVLREHTSDSASSSTTRGGEAA